MEIYTFFFCYEIFGDTAVVVALSVCELNLLCFFSPFSYDIIAAFSNSSFIEPGTLAMRPVLNLKISSFSRFIPLYLTDEEDEEDLLLALVASL